MIENVLNKFFHLGPVKWLNRYRIDVFLVFLVLLWELFGYAMGNAEVRIWAFVFTSGFVWLYLFNKLYDRVEDKISQPHEVLPDKSYRALSIFCWGLFILPIIILLSFKMPLWPFAVQVFFGFAYSYPFFKGKRLKNFFVVKNLVALINFCWPYFFLCHLLTPTLSWWQVIDL